MNVRAGAGQVAAKGTNFRGAAVLAAQGSTVRNNFKNFAQENPVLAARWVGPTYRPVAWSAMAGMCGYGAASYSDYGTTTVYQDDGVYVNGDQVATQEQYAAQAGAIAATAPPESSAAAAGAELMQLGVFAMVQGEETNATQFFNLAIDKQRAISGEYYNAATNQTEKLSGAVEKTTQRACWTVADRTTTVYEAGIANLTKDETTMLVHFGKDRTQQWTLVKINPQQPTAAGG